MKTTANYGLKKPEGTDVVNIDDFNENADIIDTQIKSLNDKRIDYGTASGTNTYTVTITGATLTEGRSYKIKFTNANTGAATLNINGLGAKSIVKSNGNALSSGNIKAGQILHLVYTGSVFQLLDEGGEYGTATADKVLTGYTIGTESGIVSGTMPNNSGKTQEAIAKYSEEGFVRLRPPKGYYDGVKESSIDWTDENFKRENIKSGVTIFGQTGTFTSDATATASQILSGKTAYVKGNKITGTMPNNGAKIITPSTTNQAIPAGYHNGSGYVKGDTNLKPENIKNGVSIFGVAGNLTVKSLGGYGVGDRIPSSRYSKEFLETVWSFTGHTDDVRAAAIDNDGYVYSGGSDKTVKKISSNGNQVWSFTGHTDRVLAVAVDNNGYVYSGSGDKTLRKIDSNGNQVWSFTSHTNYVSAVAVDNNGYVYSGSWDKTLRKISSNGSQVWSFTSHTDYVNAVAVDNNGYVYSGSDDKTVKKISSNGNQVWSFTGHTDSVLAVAVDNDGYVYSGGWDKTVKKISSNGNQVWSFTGHTNYVSAVAVDNDGYVYSGGWDKTVKKLFHGIEILK